MPLEIGSGPRGRSISQLDGSRAQLREKCSNGRAESMPQSQKMSEVRDCKHCKPLQHFSSLHTEETVTFQIEWQVSLTVVQISWQYLGFLWTPVLMHSSLVITSSHHGASIFHSEMKQFNLALAAILSKHLEQSCHLDAATQSLPAPKPELFGALRLNTETIKQTSKPVTLHNDILTVRTTLCLCP